MHPRLAFVTLLYEKLFVPFVYKSRSEILALTIVFVPETGTLCFITYHSFDWGGCLEFAVIPSSFLVC